GYSEVGILNEQSAAFDDFAAAGQPALVGPAFGNWAPVSGSWARLRSGTLGVEWSASQVPGATLYAGREKVAPDFDWAVLDYMITMQDEALSLGAQVRGKALTVVGGPYPSGEPETFVEDFDIVAVGEGEETIVSIMEHLDDRRFEEIAGVVFRRDGELIRGMARQRSKDMSHLPLPYRGDVPNDEYIRYWRKHWKDATTPL